MKLVVALAIGSVLLLGGQARASTIALYAVGASGAATALDPLNQPLAGSAVINWTDLVGPDPIISATLSILAEGIDAPTDDLPDGERDPLYINNVFVGYLTQQAFYSGFTNLRPGPGALANTTAETLSFFDVTPFLVNGLNSFSVVVAPGGWVNEIQVATLSVNDQTSPVPEPASLLLLGTGVAAAVGRRWRKRRA